MENSPGGQRFCVSISNTMPCLRTFFSPVVVIPLINIFPFGSTYQLNVSGIKKGGHHNYKIPHKIFKLNHLAIYTNIRIILSKLIKNQLQDNVRIHYLLHQVLYRCCREFFVDSRHMVVTSVSRIESTAV